MRGTRLLRRRRPAPPARRLRHRRAPAARGRPDTARARASSTSPTASPPTPPGACSSPTTSTTASCASAAAPLYPYKGRWGSYGTAPGRLAYPRGIAVDADGNVYVANTGNDRIDVFDKGGALLRSFGASGRAPGQFDAPRRRRRRRRRHPRGDRLGQRPPRSCSTPTGRWPRLGLSGAGADDPPRPGGGRLRRRAATPMSSIAARSRIVVFARGTGLPARTIGSPGSGPGQLRNPAGADHRRRRHLVRGRLGQRAHRALRHRAAATWAPTTGVGDGRGIAVTPDGTRTYVSTSANASTSTTPSGSEVDEFGGEGNKLGKLESPGADRARRRRQPVGRRPRQQPHPAVRPGRRAPAGLRRARRRPRRVHPPDRREPRLPRHADRHRHDNNRVQQFTLAAPAVTPCAAPLPVGDPPPPKLPTLPAPLGPAAERCASCAPPGLVSTRTLPAARGLRHRLHAHGHRDRHPGGGAAAQAPPRDRDARHGQARRSAPATRRSCGPTLSKANARAPGQGPARRVARLEVNVQIAAKATTGEPAAVTKRVRATR